MPTTTNGTQIVAKVRSTRKGKKMETPLGGTLGVEGRSGVHYYNVTVVGGVAVPQRLQCDCPAHRFRRAKIVQQTGFCKHIHKVIQEMAVRPDVRRTEKGDVIVYAPETIRLLAAAR